MKKFLFAVFINLFLTGLVYAGHYVTSAQNCSSCHKPNLISQHGGFTDLTCSKCHKSTNSTVVTTIENGTKGIAYTCASCHGATSHLQMHDTYIANWNTIKGVEPGTASIWSQITTFTVVNPAQKQSQVCFRCHSYYGLGSAPNGVSSVTGPSGVKLTDQALEVNPANKSSHPIRVSLNNQTGSTAPKALTSSQMKAPWTSVGNQTMLCSSCHGRNTSGAIGKFMLVGDYAWPARPDTNKFWSLGDVRNNQGSWQTKLLCAKCHTLYSGGRFMNNVHGDGDHQDSYSFGNTSYSGIPCVACHLAIPHGAKRSRLIAYETDVAPYIAYQADGTKMAALKGFRKASSPNGYSESSSCWSSVRACDEHNSYSGSAMEP